MKYEPSILEGPGCFHSVFVFLTIVLCCCTKIVKEYLKSILKVHVGVAVPFEIELSLVGFGDEGEFSIHQRRVHGFHVVVLLMGVFPLCPDVAMGDGIVPWCIDWHWA